MFSQMTTGTILGLIGVLLSLLSASMKNMQALRTIAIFANAIFLIYALLENLLPTIILSGILVPLNSWRLYQITRLVKDIENATADTPIAKWLLPHMRLQAFPAGHTLFRKGDVASDMFFVAEGVVRLREIDLPLKDGALFGELGIFSTARQRTQSATCETDTKLYVLSRDAVLKLYYQQPKLGFYLISLIVDRLTTSANGAIHDKPNPTD